MSKHFNLPQGVGVPGLMSNKSEMKLLGLYFMKWMHRMQVEWITLYSLYLFHKIKTNQPSFRLIIY